MRVRSVLTLIAFGLFAVFTTLNWQVFNTPTRLDLLVGVAEAPLGLVMLGVLAFVVLGFALQMVLWQGSILRETRRHERELHEQRLLADQAEASRFSELRTALREEMAQVERRLDEMQGGLRGDLQEHANSLASMIGEMDDRLRRQDAGSEAP